ncbi:hypothetical protein [Asticcacaulis sp. AC402]|uniref:hypothetical protein n=1 Tax=Asticcacaulis sp. AC402 TaxID=1282361 RepID=UPI0003C3B0B5|nr:hypothetical protein [Asticcacaulis sp. AC402]ESQ73438.1 hypothetical protein ABAC402_19295 [Asticcacaulis sp. AC402]
MSIAGTGKYTVSAFMAARGNRLDISAYSGGVANADRLSLVGGNVLIHRADPPGRWQHGNGVETVRVEAIRYIG